ncbi:Hypothetical protein, putative [Bodo saltans]|uniref:GPI-anchored surface protein n=1 Tax=Bodo saltans TaxID=75058 RepID=A0A0S4JAV7_BODSA|nr:Hypothetical protein, putative [Bodo saltans]|eukprot:CUG88706.1 Hypothetical protein, putative [Bodo saltans]
MSSRLLLFAALAALITAPTSATISYWDCNAADCGHSSCSFVGNITEDTCTYSPKGDLNMIKANCTRNPTSAQLCISAEVYGPLSSLPGGAADAIEGIEVTQTYPAGICLPTAGPNGTPAIIFTSGTLPTATFSYNCNTDCSVCANSGTINGTLLEAGGFYRRLTNVFSCPTLIAYQEYSREFLCDRLPLSSTQYFVPGVSHCNGYTGRVDAKANLFTCI